MKKSSATSLYWERLTVEIVPAKGNLPPITAAALHNPEISNHLDRTMYQRCILDLDTSPTRLSTLVRQVHVASLLVERRLLTAPFPLRKISYTVGRQFRRFLFWAFRFFHRRGYMPAFSNCDVV
jgi:hypothetical protein